MKTIALLHYTAPPVIGETENTIYHHARLLNQAGYTMRVISSGRDEAYYQISFRHQVEHISIDLLNPTHPRVAQANDALKRGQMPEGFETLVAEITNKLAEAISGVQVCIFYNPLSGDRHLALAAALFGLAQKGRLRLINWQQDTPTPGHPTDRYPWNLVKQTWPGASYVAANRVLQKDLVGRLSLDANQVKMIPGGVDIDLFLKWEPGTVQLVEELDLISANPLILAVAPIAPGRGIEFAIQVLAALINRRPTALLLVVAHPQYHTPIDGSYLGRLVAQLEQAGFSQNIHFFHASDQLQASRKLSPGMMLDLYQLADLLLLPDADPASASIPLLEAGLARLPVLCTCANSLPGEYGNLVQECTPGEPAHLAEEILANLTNYRIGSLQRLVSQNYTWQAILEKHLIPLIEDEQGQ